MVSSANLTGSPYSLLIISARCRALVMALAAAAPPHWLPVISCTFALSPAALSPAVHSSCRCTGMPVLWHQDGSYWPIRPMTVTTFWLAVDRSDEGNGCLRVVKGSHKQTLKELKTDRSVLNVLGATTHSDQDVPEQDIVDLVLNPGDISIHHPNLVHGSHANTSNRRRCGLTIRYIPTSTEVVMKEQPVLMMRGRPVEGVNTYRSFPPFRPDVDFSFRGSSTWNDSRFVNPSDEAFFERDNDAIRAEINAETLSFVDALGGRHA